MKINLKAIILFLLFTKPVLAIASLEAQSLSRDPIITPGYMFKVGLSLALILIIILMGAKYALPKLAVRQSKNIQILERIGLEPNVSAYIIKVKGLSWLIVVSNKNVTVVDKIDPKELDLA